MRSTLPLLLALALALPAAAGAQDRDFALLQDSLAGEADIPDLRGRILALASTSAPDALTERGFVLLRLFELTHQEETVEDARDAFELATRGAPGNAWAHYGLGLAFANSPEIRVRGPLGLLKNVTIAQDAAEILGRDPVSRARRALFRAVELDPSLAPAALELADLALSSRDPATLEEARAALALVRGTGGDAALSVNAALSDVEAALGNPARAESAAVEALGRADADSALVMRSLAEARLRQPGREAEGAETYFAGVARMDEASAVRYYRDVEVIATPNEQLQWKSADLAGRRAWLHEFWDMRAALSGVTTAERIAEHYRRLGRALRDFRRQRERGSPPSDAMLFESTAERQPFDDRGLIYIRYGEPSRIIRTTGGGVRPNETWVYDLPEGEARYFHLIVLQGGQDYTLTDDILTAVDVIGSESESTVERMIRLLDDRALIEPRYGFYANQLRETQPAQYGANTTGGSSATLTADIPRDLERDHARLRQQLRADALEMLEHDAAWPHFEDDVPFYYDLYTFRGEGGRTDVTAAFALPGDQLRGRPHAEHTYYAVELSFILVDTVADLVTRRDTVYEFRALRPLGPGEYARFHLDLDALPAQQAVHRVLVRNAFDPAHGQMYGGPLEVTDYHGEALQLSEIVLAEAADSGAWHRGRASLQLLPPRRFQSDQPFTVFYEIYGLPADAPYETRVIVEQTESGGLWNGIKRIFGGGGPPVELRFEGRAAPDSLGRVQEIRRVTASLDDGRYRVRVLVRNLETGESAEVERLFIVLE